ncbi:hypothetical protein [Pseudomonas maumuensis]|uniref:DUF4440 domain-containing protein n=1 Tax=Pseudomonas maumuensis TaxID=2842354 RepID=A0ABX8NG66_9PSED|nr:hypothetical protein [Pseudomonas maumuensis]QXH55102.1 hypothetical protein KSS90_17345 [Pseudomonas maumuensis]
MSLDLFLEADAALDPAALANALQEAGAIEVTRTNDSLQAYFASWLTLTADLVITDHTLYAEETKALDFRVATRCSIRIKGPGPQEHSPMADLDRIANAIARTGSRFVISFQFERTLYWQDAEGLHRHV